LAECTAPDPFVREHVVTIRGGIQIGRTGKKNSKDLEDSNDHKRGIHQTTQECKKAMVQRGGGATLEKSGTLGWGGTLGRVLGTMVKKTGKIQNV